MIDNQKQLKQLRREGGLSLIVMSLIILVSLPSWVIDDKGAPWHTFAREYLGSMYVVFLIVYFGCAILLKRRERRLAAKR